MRMEDLKGIVNSAEELRPPKNVHRDPRDSTGAQPKQDGAPARDHAGGGRDGNQARNHALHGTNDRRFLEKDHVHGDPAKEAHRGTDVCVEHGDTSVRARGVRITAVEAVPARPENAGSDEHECDVAGFSVYAIGFQARADPPCAYKACCAGGEMNHVSAGVIDDAHLVEEAATPDAESADAIGEGQPERHKDHPGREIHAAEVRSGRDDERNGREDELEINHRGLREVLGQRRGWKDGLLELVANVDGDARVAYERKHLISKGHLVSPYDPA